MNLETILSLLGGSVGVFLLKTYNDWRNAKRGDRQDIIGAWQQMAEREKERIEKIEARVALLEKLMLEKDFYIKQLERVIADAGQKLPILKENM